MDSFDFVSFGFAFALAKDLKMSDLSRLRLAVEPDFLRVLVSDAGCGVDLPDVLPSDVLPLLAGASFPLGCAPRLGLAVVLGAADGAADTGSGARLEFRL